MNSGYLPLIIGLIYLVIHIASIVAKEAAKRKERERMMEQAERRRMAEARLEVPPPEVERGKVQPLAWNEPTPIVKPAPPTARGAARTDDLATRRRQQMEQLRARQIGGPSQQTSTVQMPGHGTPASPLPPAPFPQQRRAESDRERLRREAGARADQQARAARQRAALAKSQKLQQAQRETDRRRRAESASMDMDVSGEIPQVHAVPISRPKALPATMRRLQDRNALRELIVLKEIIDPPLALRQQPL